MEFQQNEDLSISLKFKFENEKELDAFQKEVKELSKEKNGTEIKESFQEKISLLREELNFLETNRLYCFYDTLALELITILEEYEIDLKVKVKEKEYDDEEDELRVYLFENDNFERKKKLNEEINNLIAMGNEVCDLSFQLDCYTQSSPYSATYIYGKKISSENIIKHTMKLPFNKKMSYKRKGFLYEEILENLRKLLNQVSHQESRVINLPNFFDNRDENLQKENEKYPELIMLLKKENPINVKGEEYCETTLIIRVERDFSGLTLVHLKEFDFEEEIELIKRYFEEDLKKVFLKSMFT